MASDRAEEPTIGGEAEAGGARVSRRSAVGLVALVLLLLDGVYRTMQGNLLVLLGHLHAALVCWIEGS